ncbi:hypothetical protein BC833DRAFT_658573 [Globomyces pollinis-pini]|nr:hypothetical protein BC833DRAFT_658573 [Globomyces pollinis-pini]
MIYCIAISLAVTTVYSKIILESQWSNSWNCHGPPDAVYSFNVNDESTTVPNDHETWSKLYTAFIQYSPLGTCGLGPQRMDSCCIASTDLTITYGLKSGSPSVLETNKSTYDNYFYQSMKGNTYCQITPTNNSILRGFNDVFFLADGSCIDDYFQCTEDHEFIVYNNTKCQGDKVIIKFDSSKTQFSNDILGQFDGQLRTDINGSISTKWTTYQPFRKSRPMFPYEGPDIGWDRCAIILLITSLLLHIVGFLYSIRSRIRMKSSSLYPNCMILNQFLSLLLSINLLINVLSPIPSIDVYVFHVVTIKYLLEFSSLSSALLTMLQFYLTTKTLLHKRTYYAILILLLAIHLIFTGGVYLEVCWVSSTLESTAICNYSFRARWLSISDWWFVVLFIWNIIPSTLTAIYVCYLSLDSEHRSIQEGLKKLWNVSKAVFVIVTFQFIMLIFYITYSEGLQTNFFQMKSDKQLTSLNCGKYLLRAINSNVNLVFLSFLPSILNQMQQSKSFHVSSHLKTKQ